MADNSGAWPIIAGQWFAQTFRALDGDETRIILTDQVYVTQGSLTRLVATLPPHRRLPIVRAPVRNGRVAR